MKENETINKNKHILIALALITFIVATIGSTFSFFTAYIRGNESADKIQLQSVDILMTSEGTEVLGFDILPGWEDEMVITLKNVTAKENIPATYTLNWEIIANEINNNDLVYTIKCDSTDSNGNVVEESKHNKTINRLIDSPVPTASSTIGTAVINSGDTHTCTIKLKFKETGTNQNLNQEKVFRGNVIAIGGMNTYSEE